MICTQLSLVMPRERDHKVIIDIKASLGGGLIMILDASKLGCSRNLTRLESVRKHFKKQLCLLP
jgi:hypothetical protein